MFLPRSILLSREHWRVNYNIDSTLTPPAR
jgi:hypothetical protein